MTAGPRRGGDARGGTRERGGEGCWGGSSEIEFTPSGVRQFVSDHGARKMLPVVYETGGPPSSRRRRRATIFLGAVSAALGNTNRNVASSSSSIIRPTSTATVMTTALGLLMILLPAAYPDKISIARGKTENVAKNGRGRYEGGAERDTEIDIRHVRVFHGETLGDRKSERADEKKYAVGSDKDGYIKIERYEVRVGYKQKRSMPDFVELGYPSPYSTSTATTATPYSHLPASSLPRDPGRSRIVSEAHVIRNLAFSSPSATLAFDFPAKVTDSGDIIGPSTPVAFGDVINHSTGIVEIDVARNVDYLDKLTDNNGPATLVIIVPVPVISAVIVLTSRALEFHITRPRIPQIRVSNTRLAQAASGCAPSVDVLPIFDVKQQSVRNPARGWVPTSLVGLVITSVWGKESLPSAPLMSLGTKSVSGGNRAKINISNQTESTLNPSVTLNAAEIQRKRFGASFIAVFSQVHLFLQRG
ncbi:hypothetical protein WN51_02986 [Melipona quadrifasciata]|uniref:Uncharacterized protein n=1 Tax=Melipona quadrifasciata TaxID=166423 RepID=A0A0N0BEM4_9HYME|nr:hypothetical protein WN51_02986 [Melipona quadrifasciata]